MNVTLITRTNGNMSSITIKRSMSFKIVPVATSNLDRALRSIIVNLSNMGYNVAVKE